MKIFFFHKLNLSVLVCVLGLYAMSTANAQDLPEGTYLASCIDCHMDKTELKCKCKAPLGGAREFASGWEPEGHHLTTLDVGSCKGDIDIANCGGKLKCGGC